MFIVLNCGSSSEDVYDKIISTQQAEFTALITVFIAVIGIIGYATYLYNRKIAKEEIKAQVDEIFTNEKDAFLTGVKKEFQNELNFQKGESARLFTISNYNDLKVFDSSKEEVRKSDSYLLKLNACISWLFTAIENYMLCKNASKIRICVDFLLVLLERVVDEKIEKEYYAYLIAKGEDDYNEFYNLIKKIDDALKPEKKKIIELLDKIKETGSH